MSIKPGPLTLGVLDARSIRNKGLLLAYMVASNDLDFLCLTETNIPPFDSDPALISVFLTVLVPQVLVVVLGFFIRSSYRPDKIESPFSKLFQNMVVSIGLHSHSLLHTCIYHSPGSCTCSFREEFILYLW